ncbi:MAG: hypothetical protein U0992_08605 [Planctomycetaceae bacterium]
MALDCNNALANALLDRFDTELPAGAILEIRTGSAAGAENSAGGTLLASITLPSTPWAAASSGAKAKNGTWSATAGATGTAAHYRLKNSGDTRRIEGTVTATGGGGDLMLDNTSIASGQTVTVNTFQYSIT